MFFSKKTSQVVAVALRNFAKRPRLGPSHNRPDKIVSSYSEQQAKKVMASTDREINQIRSLKKDDKVYINRMSENRIEKIGSHSLLDKQWAEKPLSVIKNPHKLSEVELHMALQKIMELPEKRLKNMLKMGNEAIDEVFLRNIAERANQFLTVTLVELTKSLLLQKDYFRDHPLWTVLERELYKRRSNLDNDQLSSVIHAFGVTGNGQKGFFQGMEEIVTDSPIFIETPHLIKILQGYAEVDQGSPGFYSIISTGIQERGLEELTPVQVAQLAKILSKATNVSKGGYGFYAAMEKHLKNELYQGRVRFDELESILENLLPANLGSNEFHLELEKFTLLNFNEENLQDFVKLVKAFSLYTFKLPELDMLIHKTIAERVNDFSLKQLELLLWSMSRKHLLHDVRERAKYEHFQFSDLPDYQQASLSKLIERVKNKSPSMRPRGVAFALESIANLNYNEPSVFARMERVVLAKLDDFIPHYLVKVLTAFDRVNQGSSELYDQVIHRITEELYENEADFFRSEMEAPASRVKYSDLLRFFEVFPKVSYIFENQMTFDLYKCFILTVVDLLKDKKFPTEDVARVFNILVKISPFYFKGEHPEKFAELHQKFIFELMGRLRHSAYDVPKTYFAETISNLIEFQQPTLARKFVPILKDLKLSGQSLEEEFLRYKVTEIGEKPVADYSQLIEIAWSLLQIESVVKESIHWAIGEKKGVALLDKEWLGFLEKVDPVDLSSRHFKLFKQAVGLAAQLPGDLINSEAIFEKIVSIPQEKSQALIAEEEARHTNPEVASEIQAILAEIPSLPEGSVVQNFSDELLNLMDVAVIDREQEIQLCCQVMNDHCYLPHFLEQEPLQKRSVELQTDLLSDLFGWEILLVDQEHFSGLPSNEEKRVYLFSKMEDE